MRRAGWVVAVAAAAVLAALFWATTPSVAPVDRPAPVDVEAVRPAPAPRPTVVPKQAAAPEGQREIHAPGPPGSFRRERGALRRLRHTYDTLLAVDDRVALDPEMTPEEQAAALARPIREKSQILGRLQAEVAVIQGAEDRGRAARALLLMADAHEHMAGWLRDRPHPTYLSDDEIAAFQANLDQRADDQLARAREVRAQAEREIEALPEDHPLRADR